jgi:hypothetical protein
MKYFRTMPIYLGLFFSIVTLSIAGQHLIGAKAAEETEKPTLEQMLTYAIQDEYLARAEYDYIIKTFDVGRPFTNIIRSEETHISMLEPLFEKYGYKLPSDDVDGLIPHPENVRMALETGVQAEIDNIAMYAKFLELDLPEDIRAIFEQLKNASQNHLNAFRRNLSKYN